MLRSLFRLASTALIVLLIVAIVFVAHEWNAPKPLFVGNFYNRAFIKFMLRSPEGLTSMGMLDAIGIHGHNANWDNESIAAEDAEFDYMDNVMRSMALYQDDELEQDQRLSKQIIMELLGDPEEARRYRYHNYPVNQISGLQISIPRFLDTFHQVENARDARHYIERLSKIDTKMAQAMEGLLVREEMGIIPPTFVIEKSVQIMEEFVAGPVEENVLFKSFATKLTSAEKIDAQAQQDYLAQAKVAIEGTVFPAYQRYIEYFTALRDKSTNDAGVWKFPDGEAFYAYQLRRRTTTNLSAEEIHATGVAEVERIQSEMLTILDDQGYNTADGFTEAMDALAAEDRFYYPDTDVGREQILEDYRAIIQEIDAGLGDYFHEKPGAGIEVRRVPEFSEQTSSGAYYNGPSMDGSRPGIFYANLYDIRATPRYGMRTLAYHEAIPGHHYQIATQTELEGVPAFRKQVGFTAYSEGWALYAERVAWELGFQDDPFDNLGRLQAELFRAVRLVVDTGIHAMRWTREEAIDYMKRNTGIAESDVIAEIERYIVWPAQATAYKVGMMEFLALREEARAALGDHFDIRDFHEVALKNGAVPLHVLRELVMEYIERVRASTTDLAPTA